jgi:prophage antirepressor-like protein
MREDRWFVAKDVCHPDALDIVNVSQAVARLDPDALCS